MKKSIFSQIRKDFGTSGVLLLLILMLLVGGLGGVLVERVVLPYFSTWPIFRNFSVLRPDTPIVITKREEVRIQDGVNRIEVVNRVKNSLVTLYAHRGEFDSGLFTVEDAFSGVVISDDGLILTASAKIRAGLLLTAVRAGGESFPAEVLAEDPLTGLAILKIEAEGLPAIRQGFSENLQEGERLIGVWADESADNPASLRLEVVRPGTVRPSLVEVYSFNELNTGLEVLWPEGSRVLAAALVNIEGELMGMEVLADPQPFSVRAEDIKLLIDNYLDDEEVVWPRLNLDYQVFGSSQVRLFDLSKDSGALLKSSLGTLKSDDFVFAINGTTLSGRESFQETLLAKPVGSRVKLKLIRDGEEKVVEIGL